MSKTMIEYADHVWNPITGCTKVSDGCRNCWAERFSKRLKVDFNEVKVKEYYVTFPKKPKRIFVCSMSDLFHESLDFHTIAQLYTPLRLNTRHTFLVLTKRIKRAMGFYNYMKDHGINEKDLSNIWLGVSVEDQATANERIPILLQIPAAVRWVSAEPLLNEIKLCSCRSDFLPGTLGHLPSCWVKNIDWLVTGGESGPEARPSHPDWFRSLRDQCSKAGIPFWFKQWGEWAPDCLCKTEKPHFAIKRPEPGPIGRRIAGCMFLCGKKRAGNKLDGKTYNQLPGYKTEYPYLSANGV